MTGEDDLARLGDVVQPDGDQPPAPDPAARGAEPGPATLRLRRVPRAAHAADHRAAGRVGAPRRERRLRPARPRRAAELLQRELDRFETLLVDLLEISRFDAGAAALDLDDVNLTDVVHRVVDGTRALAEQRNTRVVVRAPETPCVARGRRTPGRADRAQPRHQRHRPRREQRDRGDRGGRRAGGRDRGPRPRRRAGGRVSRPWCSTGSGAPTPRGPAPAVAPAWGWRSRSRTPTCTAAGCRPGASPHEGAQFRLTLPRHARHPLRHSPLPLVPEDAAEVVA